MDTTDRICPTGRDVVVHILPIFTLQYLMGVLVQLKNTTLLRIALLPVIPWVISRAVLALDFSCGQQDEGPKNAAFATYMASFVARAIVWTLERQPYKRDNVSEAEPTSIPMACWNAFDLLFNVRGIGWNWSKGIPVPRSSVQSQSRPWFLLSAITRVAFMAVVLDVFTEATRSHFPNSDPRGIDTIFDHSLPPISRYFRVFRLVYLALWQAYFTIEWGYQLLSVVGVVAFYQHPSQWPPLFDKPWSSTSLSDLWGRRWHQMLRHFTVALGGTPLAYFLGRPGYVLGTFLLSGAIHYIEFRATGCGGNSTIEAAFFVMNAIGVLLERAWSKMRGHRIGGVYGWIWTFSWLTLWSVPMVDQWAKIGRVGEADLMGGFRPAVSLLSLAFPASVDKGFVANCLCFGISMPFLIYTLFALS
ncbi:hypothetical protein V8B97DRAFT_419707 [Scleroderma yunnanense]